MHLEEEAMPLPVPSPSRSQYGSAARVGYGLLSHQLEWIANETLQLQRLAHQGIDARMWSERTE